MCCDVMYVSWYVVMCICVQVDASNCKYIWRKESSHWQRLDKYTTEWVSEEILLWGNISALKQLTTSQPPLLFGNIHLWVLSSVSFLLLRYLISAPSSQSSSVSQFFSQHSMSTLSTLPAQLCNALSHRWSSPHPPWLYKTHPLDRGCPKDTSLLLISGRFQWWKRCRIQRCAGRFFSQDMV